MYSSTSMSSTLSIYLLLTVTMGSALSFWLSLGWILDAYCGIRLLSCIIDIGVTWRVKRLVDWAVLFCCQGALGGSRRHGGWHRLPKSENIFGCVSRFIWNYKLNLVANYCQATIIVLNAFGLFIYFIHFFYCY